MKLPITSNAESRITMDSAIMTTCADASAGLNKLHEPVHSSQEPNGKEPKTKAKNAITEEQATLVLKTSQTKTTASESESESESLMATEAPPLSPCSATLSYDSTQPGHIECLDHGQARSMFLLWKALFDLEASHAGTWSQGARLHLDRDGFDLQYEHEEKKNRRSIFWSPWKKNRHARHSSSSSTMSMNEMKVDKMSHPKKPSKTTMATPSHVFHSLQFGIASLSLNNVHVKRCKKMKRRMPRTSFSEELWRGFLFRADLDADSTLLRFLRARNWELERAITMLTLATEWRARNAVFEIIRQGEASVAHSIWSSSKFYFHQTDRSGRPVIYLEIRKHYPKEQTHLESQLCMIYNMEISRRFFCSSFKSRQSPCPSSFSSAPSSFLTLERNMMETVTLVFNMTGFTLNNMDTPVVKFLIHCLQNYYPETLGRCLIVAAPALFWIVWKMIRPWLDPVVAAKVFFIKLEDLGQYVDEKNMLKAYGGTNDYEFIYDMPEPTPRPESELRSTSSLGELKSIQDSHASMSSNLLSPSSTTLEMGGVRVSLEENLVVASDEPELTRLQQEFYAARSEFIQLTRTVAEAVEPIVEPEALASTFSSLDTVIERRKELKTQLYALSLALDEYTVPSNYYHRHGLIDGKIRQV